MGAVLFLLLGKSILASLWLVAKITQCPNSEFCTSCKIILLLQSQHFHAGSWKIITNCRQARDEQQGSDTHGVI